MKKGTRNKNNFSGYSNDNSIEEDKSIKLPSTIREEDLNEEELKDDSK